MTSPPGPYFSTFGPLSGPLLASDSPPAIGIVLDPAAPPMPDGIAFPVGHVEHGKHRAATFRLQIGKADVDGLWVCVARRFKRVDEGG